jgi:acyl-CoA synthetase (AMP-forming)/AMP-acid ligase II
MTQWATVPPVERIGDLVRHQAASQPDEVALIEADRQLTYGQLDELVERCTAALVAAGFQHGQRLAMVTTPRWEQVVVFLACARVGGVFVGLDPRHSVDELVYVIRDCAPALLIAQVEFEGRDLIPALELAARSHPAAAPRVVLDAELPGADPFERFLAAGESQGADEVDQACSKSVPSDPVAVVYTSGSTGERKGALLTHQGLLWTFWPGNWGFPLSAPIRCLNDLPVDHIAGLAERLLPSLVSGGAAVTHPRFNPQAFLGDAERHRVTYLQGEVTQWLRCVQLDEFDHANLESVEVALYTGAAAPPALLKRLAARFPRVATCYGMSETSGGVTATDRITADSPSGVVGRAIHGVQVRVVDDGHVLSSGTEGTIQVRGVPVIPGYLGRPAATRKLIDPDGWLDTGDRGVLSPDGTLRLVGRNSDMYKSGGYNIYPHEIERVIEAHPDVVQAAVVSVPDGLFQEVGAAFVALRAGARVQSGSLDAFCRDHLADYKVPKAFHVLSELPLLANGKVDKRELRGRHERSAATPLPEADAAR